ncbi:hypothetical protein PT287_09845 [Lactobacillus sp. ESL0679]|nr:hypothetical protein [Lactobacillus sp. ESL0679]MDF7683800.1 hypothetical protein [Lactobacillus sp. ESL0679]
MTKTLFVDESDWERIEQLTYHKLNYNNMGETIHTLVDFFEARNQE